MISALALPFLVTPQNALAQARNRAPVIHGISSPTVLNAGETGTWTIDASDPEDGTLSYSVDWGDTAGIARAAAPAFVQTSEFTHEYDSPGTYTVRFTVADQEGRTSRSSVTVKVRGETNALTITNLEAVASNPKKATVSWNTDQRSNSMIWYSTESPVDTTEDPDISRPSNTTKHKIQLTRLTPDTTYYVVVRSVSKKTGASAESSEISFRTPALPSQAPVITSLDGPTALMTDEEGEWTLNAYDPNNSALSYSVDWGDTMGIMALSAMSDEDPFVQTSTFSHVYENPGTYTAVFTVKNEDGLTAQTSTTIVVTEAPVEDTTPPVLSNLAVGSIGTNQATVSWTTDEEADGRVWGELDSDVDTSVPPALSDSSLSTTHSFDLTGLTASTTYFIVVGSADAEGNLSTSSVISFTTNPTVVTPTPPVLSDIVSHVGSTTITQTWTTDVPADSTVQYSLTSPVGGPGTITISDLNLVTEHSVTITDLATSTEYFFIIQSKDADGEIGSEEEFSVITTEL
jgi:PKD repeat protein